MGIVNNNRSLYHRKRVMGGRSAEDYVWEETVPMREKQPKKSKGFFEQMQKVLMNVVAKKGVDMLVDQFLGPQPLKLGNGMNKLNPESKKKLGNLLASVS